MSGPLKGFTVVELAGIGPGPHCAMMLADMGADVIRIDRKPLGNVGGFAEIMKNDNVVDRGRRSISLDLKSPQATEIVLRLVEKADALIEGFRPGVAEKLGLGPDVCLQRNPRLVYGRMTGWGQSGPLAQAAGHDLNYIALSGALHAMGEAGRPPMPPLNLVGDYGGGSMMLAFGIVCAALEARQSGRGQVVDAAITDGTASLLAMIIGMRDRQHWSDARQSNALDGGAPFYGCYECADGTYVAIGSVEPQFYALLLQKLEITDPEFADQWDTTRWPSLRAKLAALFRTRSRAAWCELMEGTDVCFAPVLDMAEAPHHPHNVARGTFVEVDGVMQPAPVPRFDRTPGAIPARAPQAGDHTEILLAEAGYSPGEIAALFGAGIAFRH